MDIAISLVQSGRTTSYPLEPDQMQNPIIVRELFSVLRLRAVPWLQCVLAAGFALLVIFRWPTDSQVALSGTRSQEVFRLLAYGMLAALLLVLPGVPATSIVRERNQGTLTLLFNTPLTSWQILWGKIVASLALAVLMLFLSLPAAAACFAMGGISTGQLAGTYALLAVTALVIVSLGLLVSTYSMSADSAIRWTYGCLLLWAVVLLVPHYFFAGSASAASGIGGWLYSASPVAAMMSLLDAGDIGMRGLVSPTGVPMRFAVSSLILTVAVGLWSYSRLNSALFDRDRSAGMIADDQSFAVRSFRRLMFIVDPKRRSRSIGPFVNPVMVKEFRCRRFGRLHWLLRLVAACSVLSLALAILTTTQTIDWDARTIGGIMVVLQVALLVLIIPSLTAGLISTERESGGWVLLQMTPLPTGRIIWGKLLSVILTVVLLMLATLPGYMVLVYIEPGQRLEVERVVACLIYTAAFVILLSAAAGSLFRRTATATAAAYAAVLAVCGGPLLVWLGRDAPFGHDIVERVLTINPVATAFSVIRLQGFRDYDLIPANWWFLGITSVVCLAGLLFQTYRVSRPQ